MIMYYIDTCIYPNLWKKERDEEGIDLGDIAKRFFEKIERENIIVIYSDFLEKELRSKLSEEEINKKWMFFKNQENFREVQLEKKEKNLAREIEMELDYSLGFYDIIHMILVKKTNAILITRDKNLLLVAKRYDVEAKKPEYLL